MKNSKRGFTLIELLVVVAIIGILAAALLVSLGTARRASRDARRIGDLRNVQSALELYFNKCGRYPGDTTATCDGSNPADWATLSGTLRDSGLGISTLPNDPSIGATYRYYVETGPSPGQSYILGADLEGDNSALQASIGSAANAGPANVTSWEGFSTTPLGASGDCNPNTPVFIYCVGL